MSKISGKNTKPEITVRKLLHGMGYRFRLHTALPGKPDICLPRYNTIIFVHGCYWHRHQKCKRGQSTPSSNKEFWNKKFQDTQRRDLKNFKDLKKLGWNVIVVWECELKDPQKLSSRLKAELCKNAA